MDCNGTTYPKKFCRWHSMEGSHVSKAHWNSGRSGYRLTEPSHLCYTDGCQNAQKVQLRWAVDPVKDWNAWIPTVNHIPGKGGGQ